MLEKSKKLWFHEVLFYFCFCIEFLIKLLKKTEALLFFEIELVCGFDFFFFFFWVLFCALFCSWVELLISGKDSSSTCTPHGISPTHITETLTHITETEPQRLDLQAQNRAFKARVVNK